MNRPWTDAYIIHSSAATNRSMYVSEIQRKTGALVFRAIEIAKVGDYVGRRKGCTLSHIGILRRAARDVLVFEDDCVLQDNFAEAIQMHKHTHDIVYVGLLKSWNGGSSGAHAYWVSQKAKQVYLRHLDTVDPQVADKYPPDLAWNMIINRYGLKAWYPTPVDKYCKQADVPSTVQVKKS
jgi:hypothetical protein